MSSDEKEHYYNFDYLLRPPPRMVAEEQIALQNKFIPNDEDRKNLYIDLAIATMAIHGDVQYDKDVSFAGAVATEILMDSTKVTMQGKYSKPKEVLGDIMMRLNALPVAKMNYFRLFDFEMFLLRQKQERLTKKNRSV